MAVFSKKKMYTVMEAADLLRVHTNTVYKMCRTGRLPAYKMNGNYRISGEALEGLKINYDTKPGPKPKRKEGAE